MTKFTGVEPSVDPALTALVNGVSRDAFALLGPHAEKSGSGWVVRALQPAARSIEIRAARTGELLPMVLRHPAGLFEARLSNDQAADYRLRIAYRANGDAEHRVEIDDPYRYGQVLTDFDLHLLGEGTHHRAFEKLGAHRVTVGTTTGVHFAVWAPNAQRVSVVGDFNQWDGRIHPMRLFVMSGVWELFIPDLADGEKYKFEIRTTAGQLLKKSDPFGVAFEQPPQTASIVHDASGYVWGDEEWMKNRRELGAWLDRPMSIYEVHLGSWARVPEEGNRPLTYRELAPRLAAYVKELGFTHVELLPVMEHPFYGSWGYQVTGYFAPTSRYGSPDDFRFFVDTLHQAGIGVLLDWVPAHFPKDDYALRRFDGTALYEHEDPRLGEHPDWGTLIFNYGRKEVRNYLVANALYWLNEFHIDGLRVDAVASMLYLDYSRAAGEWLPNVFGGNENLAAIDFLREMNTVVYAEHPGAFTAAEESTAWPGVSRPVHDGGLGFGFKWNMGFMHDTLAYIGRDPVYRSHHHDDLTRPLLWAFDENYVLPVSHDEVVHGKGSLYGRMPGDDWQRRANVRAYLTWLWTQPGKKLIFMGCEIAQHAEWDHDRELEWPGDSGVSRLVQDLNALYRAWPALSATDADAR